MLVGTQYFYVGDSDCTNYALHSGSTIHCFTDKVKYTGLRQAMTKEQLELYNSYREIKAE